MLWQYRVGHPSFQYMKKLFPSLCMNKSHLLFQCESCQLSKHHRVSFQLEPYKESKPFALVHSDIYGDLQG